MLFYFSFSCCYIASNEFECILQKAFTVGKASLELQNYRSIIIFLHYIRVVKSTKL